MPGLTETVIFSPILVVRSSFGEPDLDFDLRLDPDLAVLGLLIGLFSLESDARFDAIACIMSLLRILVTASFRENFSASESVY